MLISSVHFYQDLVVPDNVVQIQMLKHQQWINRAVIDVSIALLMDLVDQYTTHHSAKSNHVLYSK